MRIGRTAQTALELMVLLMIVMVVMVALSLYVRYAAGGRVRAAGAAVSPSLYSAESTQTDWTSRQATQDTVNTNGLVRSRVVGSATQQRRQSF